MARQVLRVSRAAAGGSYVEWGAIFAGAIGASAISLLLITFGGSVGLSLTSPWPNSGASVWTTIIVVVWWTVMVQIGAFFVGGYLAGRMRSRWGESRGEGGFRDGAHGFLVWSVGVIIGAWIVAMTGSGAVSTATQAVATLGGGAAAGAAGAAGRSQGTSLNSALDSLLRPGPSSSASASSTQAGGNAPTAAGAVPFNPVSNQGGDSSALRSEAGRIFASSIRNGEFTARDRDYLTQVVSQRTGLSQNEAQQRVDQSVNEAKDLEIKARAAADKARKTALIAGFLTAASLLIGLAAACAGAALGGDHRDRGRPAHVFGRTVWWRD